MNHPSSVAPGSASRHLDRLDAVHPRMAKALNKVEMPWRQRIGRAIERCIELAGLSQKEAAALLDRDQAQVARWISADERPQLDVIFSVDQLRRTLVIALAELDGDGVEVQTLITIRRIA
jgi:predicted XRE-type DNA-binding protein